MKEIVLLLHGPFGGNGYSQIFASLNKTGYFSKIIISTYVSDKRKTIEEVDLLNKTNIPVEYIFSKDVINPGYFNLNRQVICVSKGLQLVPRMNAQSLSSV